MRNLTQNSVQSDTFHGRANDSRSGYNWGGKSAGQNPSSGQSMKDKWNGERDKTLVSSFSRIEDNNNGFSQSQDTNGFLEELENNSKHSKHSIIDKSDKLIAKFILENEQLKKKNVNHSDSQDHIDKELKDIVNQIHQLETMQREKLIISAKLEERCANRIIERDRLLDQNVIYSNAR